VLHMLRYIHIYTLDRSGPISVFEFEVDKRLHHMAISCQSHKLR